MAGERMPAGERQPESTAAPASATAETAPAPPVAPQAHLHRGSRTAKPPRETSRTFFWVVLVLLLLGGSNTATWFLARRSSEPAAAPPQVRPLSFGPTFAALDYWIVSGPFPAKSSADLDTIHEPENPNRDLNAELKGAKGPVKWKLVKMQGHQVSFSRELGEHFNCNGYGLTYVESPLETKAVLGIGSDDSVRVWLNGVQVHENRMQRGCMVDSDRADVVLKAGINEILVKVGQGSGEWGFALTIRGIDGKPLPGLKGCLPKEIAVPEPPKPPAPAPKPPVKPVPSNTKTTAPATKAP